MLSYTMTAPNTYLCMHYSLSLFWTLISHIRIHTTCLFTYSKDSNRITYSRVQHKHKPFKYSTTTHYNGIMAIWQIQQHWLQYVYWFIQKGRHYVKFYSIEGKDLPNIPEYYPKTPFCTLSTLFTLHLNTLSSIHQRAYGNCQYSLVWIRPKKALY